MGSNVWGGSAVAIVSVPFAAELAARELDPTTAAVATTAAAAMTIAVLRYSLARLGRSLRPAGDRSLRICILLWSGYALVPVPARSCALVTAFALPPARQPAHRRRSTR